MVDPPHDQAGAGPAQGETEKDVAPVVGPPPDTIPQPPPPPAEDSNPKNEYRWTNDPAMFWVTLAGVIAVIAYTSVAAWQAFLIRDQLIEMKTASNLMKGQLETMEIEQRPWLAVLDRPEIGTPLVVAPKIGAFFVLEFLVKNKGKNPARRVGINAELVDDSTDLDFLEEQDRYCTEASKPLAQFETTMFPDEQRHFGSIVILPEIDVIEARQRSNWGHAIIQGHVIGCVHYQFLSDDTPHRTSFIFDLYKKDPNEPRRPIADIDIDNGPIEQLDLSFGDSVLGNGPAN